MGIETTKGIFTVDLFIEERPKVCKNFLKLCKVKFYNLCLFHSIQSNFVAQTGDTSETGTSGGESIYRRLYGDQARFFEGDILPKIKHASKGILSMASAGDNMFGSQFFVTLADNLESLDANQHCVFGKVVEGFETIETLNETICDKDNRPYQDIRITHTVVLDDPFPDPPELEIPDRSPEPSTEMKIGSGSRIGADEDLDDDEGMTEKEREELMKEKEAKAQATILEMVGDLPEADCAPPENVLFVCKLNAVTTDDDLEIIFSRFGKVVSCEVIRDHKTGDSLQYAFVEFEDKDACEKAYFKMDNVLIDDRRIHVDFSQSVSKFKWKGKGRLEIVGEHTKGNLHERNKKQKYSKDQQYGNGYSRNRSRSPRSFENKDSHDTSTQNRKYQSSRHHNRSRSRSPHRSNKKHKSYRNSRSRSRDRYSNRSYESERYDKQRYSKHDERQKEHYKHNDKRSSRHYEEYKSEKKSKKHYRRSRSR